LDSSARSFFERASVSRSTSFSFCGREAHHVRHIRLDVVRPLLFFFFLVMHPALNRTYLTLPPHRFQRVLERGQLGLRPGAVRLELQGTARSIHE